MVNMQSCPHVAKTPGSDLNCLVLPGDCHKIHQMFTCDACSKVSIFPPTHVNGDLVNNWAWSAFQ